MTASLVSRERIKEIVDLSRLGGFRLTGVTEQAAELAQTAEVLYECIDRLRNGWKPVIQQHPDADQEEWQRPHDYEGILRGRVDVEPMTPEQVAVMSP
jgi:hypothetical protein